MLHITYRQLKEQNNKNIQESKYSSASESAGQGVGRLRRPRELETGISEKEVVYKCFFYTSKYFKVLQNISKFKIIFVIRRAKLLTNPKYLSLSYIFFNFSYIHSIYVFSYSLLQPRRIAKKKKKCVHNA